MSFIRRFFLRLVCFFRRDRAENELSREITAHLQFLEDKFVAEGMSPEEAQFAARRAFSGVEQTKELLRDVRDFRWLSGCTMDLKLGVRMLVKYPGLTIVGSLAMAFAIAAGTATFEAIKSVTAPDLGLPEGDRLVGLKMINRAEGAERQVYAYDFVNWRENLSTVQDMGAYRLLKCNLTANGSAGEPVTATQISAAAFRVTHVSASIGRSLVEADEASTAAPVVVLGYSLWQTRFAGNRAVLGREVKVGDTYATVVGVMPEGFRFPVDEHLWIPLRPAELSREPGRDAVRVFGRLAPGVTLPEAQAEATTLAAGAAASMPETYSHLAPQVLPYAESVIAIPAKGRAGIYALNLLAALFLIVVCGNVALLMFARAATREKELLVRTALGATRGRIVGMLFLEALVLAIIAAAMGLTAAGLLLRGTVEMLRTGPDRWPFWIDGGLSVTTVLYAGILALAAAAIAGVVPGLKVMGKGLWDRLRQSSGGAGGLSLGGVWTAVIIAQVAATILFMALAFVVQRQAAYLANADEVFPVEQFLSTRLELDPSPQEDATSTGRQQFLQRYDTTIRELARRIANESAVKGVTLAEQLPRMPYPLQRIEIERADESSDDKLLSKRSGVQTTAVDLDFFDVFQMPVLAGRRFDSRDVGGNANTVVVNSIFVEQVLNGRNAIGRRLRLASTSSSPAGPWLEIVGVVQDAVPRAAAPLNLDNPTRPRLYRPLSAAGGNPPLHLAVHVKTAVAPFVPTLRRVASELSPTLRLHDTLPLDQATSEDARFWTIFAKLVLVGGALTLLLSLAGIYSAMSFTVSRRTREIGVRVALGGQAMRVIIEIFRRPFTQVAAGVMVGWLLLVAAIIFAKGGSVGGVTKHAPTLFFYGIAMVGVCALACIGPMRRALRVQPMEALRDDT